MTIDDLRDKLRQDLHDEDDTSYRWQDDVLDRHLLRATRELSLAWPRERKTTLNTSAGSRDLDASSLGDLVRVHAVEYPTGRYPPVYVRFSLYAEVLTLLVEAVPGDSEEVAVYWGSLHTLDAMSSSLPAVAEDAVLTGAAAYAAIEWASFATNRANLAGRDTVEDYLDWGERRLKRFNEMLARLGTNSRLRISSLYSPGGAAGATDVVQWDLS